MIFTRRIRMERAAVEAALVAVKAESKGILVQILDELGRTDRDTARRVAPHVSVALHEARKDLREIKTELGLHCGSDTSIVPPEELDKLYDEYERRVGEDPA
jgi:hypothetical protein